MLTPCSRLWSTGKMSDQHRSRRIGVERVPIQLSEEEKSVLLQCRRNSLSRGFVCGVVSVLTARYLIKTKVIGQKWSGLCYGLSFLGGGLFGVVSYKQKCIDKILALDNSVLKDQILTHLSKLEESRGGVEGGPYSPQGQGPARIHTSTRPPSPYPATSPRSPSSPSSFHPDEVLDQSDAIVGSSSNSSGSGVPMTTPSPSSPPPSFPPPSPPSYLPGTDQRDGVSQPPRGRSFDEIRESNRRRQLERNYPQSSQSGSSGGRSDGSGFRRREEERTGVGREEDFPQSLPSAGRAKPVRRNKYGDVINDDQE